MARTPDLITSTVAGQILGCSGRTIVRLARRGQIPVAHVLPGPNGSLLFDRAVIEKLAETRARKAS